MKRLTLFVLLFSARISFGADSTDVIALPDVPVRTHLDDGTPIPPEQIDKIHQKDISPSGWKYDWEEWDLIYDGIPVRQEYYYDEDRHEDNGGVTTV